MENQINHSKNSTAGKIILRKEIIKYLKYWPWFIIGIIIFLSLGIIYLRYTTPVYSAKATIILNSEEKGSGPAIYTEMGAFSGVGEDLINELGIMQSRTLMKDVVKSLNLHIQYFKDGKFRTVEIYEDLPFSLQVLSLNEVKLEELGNVSFEIVKEGNIFKITNLKSQEIIKAESGNPMDLGFANVVFSLNDNPEPNGLSEATTVTFQAIEKVASKYRGKIILTQAKKTSGLIELELQDPVREKARDILDQLILEFNRNAIEDKNLIARNTANFINDRLAIINGELDSVETGKEAFKEQHLLTDIQAQSNMFLQNANDYNKRRQEVGTQLELANAMLEYIANNSRSDLLPSNLGIAESGVNQRINEYNNLVLERNRILSGSSEKNPVVIRLNNQIEQIKGNVAQSLQRLRSNLQISQEELNRQASSVGSQIYAVPAKERQFRGIERQQNIKETLYLFLLQKREENSLSLAVTEPRAKIVDRAFFSSGPVSPISRNIYLGTFILGLFVPFTAIYLREMLDDKIRRREDIEDFTKEVALVGLIPKVPTKNTLIIKNDRSILAESFRILITNLQYLLVNSRDKTRGLVFLITSSIKSEGKTFTTINLAVTLANTGKKVLIVGADLRNPKLLPFKKTSNSHLGVSDYLISDKLCVQSIIGESKMHPDVDILTSGAIPPNPYELLKLEKMGLMLKELESLYDYIIIDSAPSMLVADTFLITKYADLVIYLLRAGYTEKELLEFPLDSKREGKLPNLSFVLNGVKINDLGYGNKYGYGYGEEKRKKWSTKKLVLTPN